MSEENAKVKHCPSCMEHGIMTPVEKYRVMPVEYCTFHYWLMRGRLGGLREYSLEEYANSSRLFSFVISLPSGDAMRAMQGQKPAVESDP